MKAGILDKQDKEKEQHLQQVHQALKFVAKELNNLEFKWLLGASGALMVWGVDIVPYDLDIFTSKENIEQLARVFSRYIKNQLHYFNEKGRDYLEFQLDINGVEVEICELDLSGDSLEYISFDGELIPVNSLENELQFYQARKGKEEIVALIRKRLHEV